MAHQAVLTVIVCTIISAITLVFTAYLFELKIVVLSGGETKYIALPRSTPFIYGCLALLALGVPRMMVRSIVHFYLSGRSLIARQQREPVIIYGARNTGYQVAGALIHGGAHQVVGFVDDDERLTNTTIRGINVHKPRDLEHLIKLYEVKTVVLALGNVSRSRKNALVEHLSRFGIRIQTVPAMEDLLEGSPGLNDIRDVNIEDLLGRDPIPPRKQLLSSCIRDKVVMVTGAGGSIGSELCRQISILKPTKLVLFEQSEYALYSLEQELLLSSPGSEHVAVLGSTLNRKQLREVIQTFRVDTIYHAAAYKHVPIVEKNLIEGARNNVLGTWECLRAAMDAKVSHFVLISTDKAVRPSNIMGASKRMAELLLQGAAKANSDTVMSMVRFGNVLGSSGSVVPRFKNQITSGGPVTVTHKNITRYFMTIPEAAQLVLQASAMARSGDVFVLDMGDPVKIWDLAERMIHLSGLSVKSADNPTGDIEIKQVGLRPGEKLYEELLISNDVSGTDHPLIMRATEASLEWEEISKMVAELEYACSSYDIQYIRQLLNHPVIHFSQDQTDHDLLSVLRDKQKGKIANNVMPLRPNQSTKG